MSPSSRPGDWRVNRGDAAQLQSTVTGRVASAPQPLEQDQDDSVGIEAALGSGDMVTVQHSQHEELIQRRSASIGAIDARLSVWGQASRDAASRRADALVAGVLLYVEKVGRSAESLTSTALDPAAALLDVDYGPLVALATHLLPSAVSQSCRLLWVDPDRLRERLDDALAVHVESARAEVRRRQALYRRRARLWQADQPRLDRLRDEVEAMRVPRCGAAAAERIARGLFEHHKDDPRLIESGTGPDISDSRLKVRPGTIGRWIAQLDERIASLT